MSNSTKPTWSLEFAAGYLVPPCTDLDESEIAAKVVGSTISVSVLPEAFFRPLFVEDAARAPNHVVFLSEGGTQNNTVRDLIRSLAFGPTHDRSDAARTLAHRLASVTSRRSPDGLFFIIVGVLAANFRVVLWKFPADESIQARLVDSHLLIRIVDDAFSRKSTYFKAAMFEDIQSATSFWAGRVVDRQSSTRVRGFADFWVNDFLLCRPALTDVHGTRLLARALRETIRKTENIELREVLISVVSVLKAQPGRQLTLLSFANDFLPKSSIDEFLQIVGGEDIWQTSFNLDLHTLSDQIRIRSLTLNGDFIVRGPIDEFDEIVSVESTDAESIVRVSLEGRITSEAVLKR